jgi:hypothetical protein
MRRTLSGGLVLGWALSLYAAGLFDASADATCAAQQQIAPDTGELDRCFARAVEQAGAGMGALLSPDFFYNTSRGSRVDRAFLLDWLGRSKGSLGKVRVEQVQERLVATQVRLSSGVMRLGGEERSPGMSSRYLHVWKHQAEQGWTLLARQVTMMSTRE